MKQHEWVRATAGTFGDFGVSRRTLLRALAGFAGYALLGEAATAQTGKPSAIARWIERQAQLAGALSNAEISPPDWMHEVEALAGEIDVAELMVGLDSAQITSAGAPYHNDPQKRFVRFIDEHGEPRRLGYGVALFEFAPENVITPHGHRNMVSAHLVVKGRFRIRNFDRLGDQDNAMRIRPTRDYVAGVGALSAMCSEQDNIHWFVPQGGAATTFDVVMSGLDPEAPEYEIQAIDPVGGSVQSDGSILAPVMDFAAASRRYTADV